MGATPGPHIAIPLRASEGYYHHAEKGIVPPMSDPQNPDIAPDTQPYQPPPGNGATTPPPQTNYPGYPAGYQPSAPQAAPPPAAAPRRSGAAGAIVGVIVALLVVGGAVGVFVVGKNGSGPLAAISATATPSPTATTAPLPTATPTPVAPAGFTFFTATDGSYRIAYPLGWIPVSQTLNGATGEIFVSPDQKNAFIVYPSTTPIPPSAYSTYLQQVTALLQATDVKLSGTTTTVTLGANTWTKETGTLTVQKTPYMGAVLGTNHGAGTFLAIYAAPVTSFTSAESQYFTTMATSVTFVS